jgi:hypothetical protein
MDFSETVDNLDNTSFDIDDSVLTNNQDVILLYYTDEILDIFDDYKERFVTNPDFLCNLKGFVFINFIVDYILHPVTHAVKNTKTVSENEIFEDIFKNELTISYNIIHNFMKQFKIDISFNNWKTYCQKYSNIPFI